MGAGVTGLSAAWHLLTHSPHEVVVLDGAQRVGGKLLSGTLAGQQVDLGAESVLARRPEAVSLLGELGLDVVHPRRVPASIWSRDELVPMPSGNLMGVPSEPDGLASLLSHEELARVRAEQPVQVGEDVALGDLVSAALGDAVVDRLVEPLLGGVYAGHARRLSARACLPALYDAAAQGRSLVETARAAAERGVALADRPVFAGLRGGIGTFPPALADAVRARGGQIRTGVVVRGLRRAAAGWVLTTGSAREPEEVEADAVLLATPAAPTARLLEAECPTAAGLLADVEYASMALVTYAFPRAEVPGLTGTSGFLVPPVDGREIKAATFSSEKWPWLAEAQPHLSFVRVSFGRHREEATLQRPDAELVEDGLRDLASAVGERLPRPVDAVVQRWGGGLPQYAVGHLDRVAAIRSEVSQLPGLAVAGAAYDGVGIPACIASARAAADALVVP